MKAITVEALSKTFPGGTVAVDRIRFSLNQGEIFGFLGPNGAGKTTTVKLLCSMLTPSGGKCQVLGIDPVQNPEQLHKKVGVVTEHAQMYDHMTAWDIRACISTSIRRIARKRMETKKTSTMILPSKLNSSGRWRSTLTTF